MGRVHAAAMLVLAPTVISAAMLVMADAAAITSTMARGSDNPRASITLNALNPFSSSTIIRTAVDTHVDFSVPIYIGAREMPLEFIALLNSGASIYLADSSEYMANMFTGQILTAEGVGWFASVQTGTRRTRARDTSAGNAVLILQTASSCVMRSGAIAPESVIFAAGPRKSACGTPRIVIQINLKRGGRSLR